MRLHSQGFTFHLDEVRYTDFPAREYSVAGWCRTPLLGSPSELWLGAEGYRSPCLVGLPRPDVANHFEQPELRGCGFVGRIKVSEPSAHLDFYPEENAASILMLHNPPRFDNKNFEPNAYRDFWLPAHERGLFWPEDEIQPRMAALRERPLISVILPTFNTGIYHLHRCVMSVVNQKYPHWELCISDDGSTDPATLRALHGIAALDRRISVSWSERNGGISTASNIAIERARGEFVSLLDHDDELHPYALLEAARELNLFPETDLIYSDEDKIQQSGMRCQPAFKPAFDDDMLLAFSYLGHPVCVRRTVVMRAGGFRLKYDGAQDWDLLLRVTELSGPERVRHIAKPLYHWRLHENSTSQSLDAKPWAQAAWSEVLRSCLGRRGIAGTVMPGLFTGSMRVRREPGAGGVAAVTLLDNGDQQHLFSRVRRPEGTRFYEVGISGLHRLGWGEPGPLTTLDEMPEAVVVFVNYPLDSLSHGALEELAAHCARSDCGMVSGVLVDHDGGVLNGALFSGGDSTVLNPSGGEHLRSLGYMGMFKVVRSVPWVHPAFFAVPKRVLREAGGLSAIASTAMDELCWRIARLCHEKGLKILFTPYAVATAQRVGESVQRGVGYSSAAPIPPRLHLNSNLAHFPDPGHILRTGF